MNKNFDQALRFTPAGLTIGSILAVIVAMGLSLVFDVQPVEAKTATQVAHSQSAKRA